MSKNIQLICRVNTDNRVEDEPRFLMVGLTLVLLDSVGSYQRHIRAMAAEGLNPYKVTTFDAPPSVFVDPFALDAPLDSSLLSTQLVFNDDEEDAFDVDTPTAGLPCSTLKDLRDKVNSVDTLIMEVKTDGILIRAGFANEYWASTRVISNDTLNDIRERLRA